MPNIQLSAKERGKYEPLVDENGTQQGPRVRQRSFSMGDVLLLVGMFACGSFLTLTIEVLIGTLRDRGNGETSLLKGIEQLRSEQRIATTWEPRPDWTPSDHAHGLWEQVFNGDHDTSGFVIPVGSTSEDTTEVYCLSAFHQLHCLDALNTHLFGNHKQTPESESNSTHSKTGEGHLKHCIQYLTQGVLCAGDMSLEDAFTFDTPIGYKSVGTFGWSATHSCANWDMIYEFAKKHKFQSYKLPDGVEPVLLDPDQVIE